MAMVDKIRGIPLDLEVNAIMPHPRNPRKGNMEILGESIDRFGFYGRILVQKSTGYILAGNHRWKQMKERGEEFIPAEVVDVDNETALGILLADNRTSDLAEYDSELLGGLLNEMVQFGEDGLWGTGYSDQEYEDLMAGLNSFDSSDLGDEGEPITQEVGNEEAIDPTTELLAKWNCKQGQLWQAGKHRILCGDSTNPKDVERLLDGAMPYLMVTDPPYGVEYDPTWRDDALKACERSIGKVANDDIADWSKAWELSPAKVAYVWHADRRCNIVQNSLEQSDFMVRQQIIWVKKHFVLGRGHYSTRHEPCFYAVKKGKNAQWIGSHSEQTTWEINNRFSSTDQDHLTGEARNYHSTQKPVECMARPIRNHKGDVYDPFCGSGTTIVASEKQNRVCYAMELKPEYVAVILERIDRMGLAPNLISE